MRSSKTTTDPPILMVVEIEVESIIVVDYKKAKYKNLVIDDNTFEKL